MEIDIELLHKERKQWRENSLLQSKSILRLSQELDNLRKQKEILQEKLLKSVTQDQMTCLECNKEFIKTHHSQKICSKECKKLRTKDIRKRWKANNPEKVRKDNKASLIAFRKKNPDYNKLHQRKWVANNPEKVRANNIKNMKTYRIKYKDDPIRKMQQNMRSAMSAALSGKRKSQPTMDIIGCNVEELYQHFESCSSWEPWMTKENYGRNGWDVDHIIAISKWDSNCPLQFALCWDKSNLQPLDHIANIKKGNK